MPFIGDIGVPGLIIILVIALLVLGPGKLPEVGDALGRGIREFRRATDMSGDTKPPPSAPVAAQPAAQPAPETAEQRLARLTRERDELAAQLSASQSAGAATPDGGSSAS